MDTMMGVCVTAPTAATLGNRIVQLWVDILRAAGNVDGSVYQGERHTATLDHETPPEAPPEVGVLDERKSPVDYS